MEESLLSLLMEQFAKFPDAKLSLLQDTDYATTARYFKEHKPIPTEEGKDVLYEYLCRRGHFCKKMSPSLADSFEKIIRYRNSNPEPYEWHWSDEDYVEKVLHLYEDIRSIIALDNPPVSLITRIISILYGCTPTFDANLCNLLHIDSNAPFKEQLLSFKSSAWIIYAFIAVLSILYQQSNNSTFNEQQKEAIAEMAHGVYEDMEKRRKNSAKFNSKNDIL